jgi:hypothetical protein
MSAVLEAFMNGGGPHRKKQAVKRITDELGIDMAACARPFRAGLRQQHLKSKTS